MLPAVPHCWLEHSVIMLVNRGLAPMISRGELAHIASIAFCCWRRNVQSFRYIVAEVLLRQRRWRPKLCGRQAVVLVQPAWGTHIEFSRGDLQWCYVRNFCASIGRSTPFSPPCLLALPAGHACGGFGTSWCSISRFSKPRMRTLRPSQLPPCLLKPQGLRIRHANGWRYFVIRAHVSAGEIVRKSGISHWV